MRPRTVTSSRLACVAVAVALAAVLLSPLSCSQGSEDPRPRCETVLGYWTPFGAGVQLLLPVAVVLAVIALRRARR